MPCSLVRRSFSKKFAEQAKCWAASFVVSHLRWLASLFALTGVPPVFSPVFSSGASSIADGLVGIEYSRRAYFLLDGFGAAVFEPSLFRDFLPFESAAW
jgi:hypothetical protein